MVNLCLAAIGYQKKTPTSRSKNNKDEVPFFLNQNYVPFSSGVHHKDPVTWENRAPKD